MKINFRLNNILLILTQVNKKLFLSIFVLHNKKVKILLFILSSLGLRTIHISSVLSWTNFCCRCLWYALNQIKPIWYYIRNRRMYKCRTLQKCKRWVCEKQIQFGYSFQCLSSNLFWRLFRAGCRISWINRPANMHTHHYHRLQQMYMHQLPCIYS